MAKRPLEELINTIGKEQLKQIIAESLSMRTVFDKIGMIGSGHHYRVLNRMINKFNISIDHFTGEGQHKRQLTTGQGQYKGLKRNVGISLDKILIENSTYTNTNRLRKRLIKEHIFEERCNNCKLTQWMKRKIPLELEHKNGNKSDHRKENLELLCPNCHAQTKFYRGRNIGKQSN